jgi:ABC-2 type transport system permease protein
MTLRLHFRNRLALMYGYLFPLIFLAAFWTLYRHDAIPLRLHLGELLTVSILGGACFGLPTTLVSERERGLWRHYRTSPQSTGRLLLSTLLARLLILISAGAVQFGVACAVGMTAPNHPTALVINFLVVSFAFIGLGFVIAGLADNIPAVQALGQCVFLPMLILGGIAVPLRSLPVWAQHVSAFFPGRYSVEILQAATSGAVGLPKFPLVALGSIGALAFVSGANLFRWTPGQRFRSVSKKAWLLPTLAAWIAVGFFAESRARVVVKPSATPVVATTPPPPATPALAPWEKLTDAEIFAIPLIAPSDEGLVSPIARDGEMPDETTDITLAKLEGELPHWPPALVADPLDRARNLLSLAAVVDLLQNPVEKFIPPLIQARFEAELPHDKAVRLFAYIALHPDEGKMILDLSDLHLEGVDSDEAVRERVHFYAIKLLARLTNRATVRR